VLQHEQQAELEATAQQGGQYHDLSQHHWPQAWGKASLYRSKDPNLRGTEVHQRVDTSSRGRCRYKAPWGPEEEPQGYRGKLRIQRRSNFSTYWTATGPASQRGTHPLPLMWLFVQISSCRSQQLSITSKLNRDLPCQEDKHRMLNGLVAFQPQWDSAVNNERTWGYVT